MTQAKNTTPDEHPFIEQPNRTLLMLSIPVLLSLIAEPLTGLVDTIFITRLGAAPLAAVGVATAALSSVFWIFNFLGISTQTNVANALGKQKRGEAQRMASVGLALTIAISLTVAFVGVFLTPTIASALGAKGAVADDAVSYLNVRLAGAPAVLLMMTGFGILRGMQDMRTPMAIAIVVNLLNLALDYPLIFGLGSFEGFGVAGSAMATVISQYVGAVWLLFEVVRRLGITSDFNLRDALGLIQIGTDLFIRTGLMTIFLLLMTRIANQASIESGAAHQSVRQVWSFSAFVLDALAITVQSLVGYFVGSEQIKIARRAARISAIWSVVLGGVLAVVMLLLTQASIGIIVPTSAADVFVPAWIIASITQPLNSLAFISDGIHWGTGDYTYLRNGMIAASGSGILAGLFIDPSSPNALLYVWLATALWITVRAFVGMIRVFPGIGDAPLRLSEGESTNAI